VRSADIAARCREIALRVQCSGEWGELGDTLREAAAEVERLRLRPDERELLQAIVDAPITIGCCRSTIAGLLQRQRGGE